MNRLRMQFFYDKIYLSRSGNKYLVELHLAPGTYREALTEIAALPVGGRWKALEALEHLLSMNPPQSFSLIIEPIAGGYRVTGDEHFAAMFTRSEVLNAIKKKVITVLNGGLGLAMARQEAAHNAEREFMYQYKQTTEVEIEEEDAAGR